MENSLLQIALIIILLPLLGSLIAGFFGKVIGSRATHWISYALWWVLPFCLSCYLLSSHSSLDGHPAMLMGYFIIGLSPVRFNLILRLLLDRLSATMMCDCDFCFIDGAYLYHWLYGR